MAAIAIQRIVAAAPGRVFAALTQPDGIGHWWTNDLNVTAEVGSLAEFRFGGWGDVVFRFEVAELNPDEQVRWMYRFGSESQWAGTSITWRLAPVQNGTQVFFTHEGFAQVEESYINTVRGNWAYFLDSLKSYLETGQGTPGAPPNRQGLTS